MNTATDELADTMDSKSPRFQHRITNRYVIEYSERWYDMPDGSRLASGELLRKALAEWVDGGVLCLPDGYRLTEIPAEEFHP